MKQDFWKKNGKYSFIENEQYMIWLSGVFSYKDNITNVLALTEGFFSNNLDFNAIIGWYKIVIYDKRDYCWYFWGDDANSQHFFYYDKGFSDSLLEIKETLNDSVRPNYRAITQLLGGGYTIGRDTVIDGIYRTDKECYYIFDGKSVSERSKRLKNFKELRQKYDIVSILTPIKKQINNNISVAVCTGGTDSRAIISGLRYLGSKGMKYVITGHADNPDIKVGQMICDRLNESLTIINPKDRRDNWLEEAFKFTDGEYDVVLSYRHLLRAEWENINSIDFEYGGLAGEFYKNYFYMPFRWFGKKKNVDFYKNNLLSTNLFNQKWIGENIRKTEDENDIKLKKIADKIEAEHTKLEKSNIIGYDILAFKSGAITNGYAQYVTKIDPLMARALCASASHDSWVSHCMHKWQRKQITKYCKDIADIRTDQGYSCSMNLVLLAWDCVKKSVFYMDRVFNRIRRRLGLGFRSVQNNYWDLDYAEAREEEIWSKSIAYCKDNGIINPNVEDKDIPLNMTGWIILIGMMFVGA